ncbi:ATP-grasp domain-containing protein [Deinococcus yunweiensis]|uniref:ATP-grasp domain-containing protein n=1 Tax=Deinococcus yunweiensis TaxID=367282 RepID=UPI00398F60D0
MTPVHVWFNKSFAVTAALIHALNGTRYVAHASHTDATHASLHAAPQAFLEPRGLVGEAYVAWALDTARSRGIDVMVAAKERELLADHVADFAAAGVTLITPAPREIQLLLEHKDAFLRDWDASILPIPRWTTFRSRESFDAAVAELETPGLRLCMKPARGIYASGFRVLTERPSPRSFYGGELYQMTYAAARELMDAGDTPLMLLMHTLEGAERSIDCVAWQGELLSATVRRKFDSAQKIEDRPDLVQAATRIAARYGLSGLFNFQTKDQTGVAHMLEINARASGGTYLAMAGSGVNSATLLLDAATGNVRREHGRVDVVVAEHKTGRVVHTAVSEDTTRVPA